MGSCAQAGGGPRLWAVPCPSCLSRVFVLQCPVVPVWTELHHTLCIQDKHSL